MDQGKIGSFIAACRKAKGMTQAAMAEQLGITDRAVSKWETGKSLPDASIMLEVCELLEISVNELLTGERLIMENYKEQAERNLVELARMEEENNRKLLQLEWVIGVTGTVSFMVMIFAASYSVTDPVWQGVLIAVACVILTVSGYYALKLEREAGYYECPHCGHRYVPTMKSVVWAPHVGRSRYMKCIRCGRRGMHKKVLTRGEE